MAIKGIVLIMRGLPGSGKSSLAKALLPDECTYGRCSADDYFMVRGQYCFNSTLLPNAHAACFRKFMGELKGLTPFIIVDNTNIKKSWYSRYVLEAKKAGYLVATVTVEEWNPRVLSKRNKHKVPLSTLIEMAKSFER